MTTRELLIVSDGSPAFDFGNRLATIPTPWHATVCHALPTAMHVAAAQDVHALVTPARLAEGGRGDIVFWTLSAIHPAIRHRTLVVATDADDVSLAPDLPDVRVLVTPNGPGALWTAILELLDLGD